MLNTTAEGLRVMLRKAARVMAIIALNCEYGCWVEFIKADYMFPRAALISSSTPSDVPFDLMTLSNDFSAALRAKPSVINALKASCFADEWLPATTITGEPSPFRILSFKSIIIRCALFEPMPLILCSTGALPCTMASCNSAGFKDDKIMRAVDAPTPLTVIS